MTDHAPSGTAGVSIGSEADSENGAESQRHVLSSPAFVGFVSTQFLGAFNDNYFKQMVLLTCVTQVAGGGKDYQPLALAAFALPFVLLSGLGGYLSDRYSKRTVIVLCKVGEIAVMGCSLLVLLIPGLSSVGQLMLLIAVLALMGGQSAFFGPSKYGSLPEIFRRESLLPANGAVQMTTFLAIIFGTVCAGIALDQLNRSLWLGSVIAVGIAVAGTLTSLLIPRTPVAQPDLKLKLENLAVPASVWKLFMADKRLLKAVLVATMFWFVGGVTQPAVNALGKSVLQLSDTRTSLMTAGIGVGIAAGCLLVGVLAKNAGGVWVIRGAWGIVATLFVIGILSSGLITIPPPSADQTSILKCLRDASLLEWALRGCMFLLGGFAGIFVVPVQVLLQQAPPAEQKGRVIGVQNLCSWIGILISAVFLGLANFVLARIYGQAESATQQYLIFVALAVVMAPVALWYRMDPGTAD